MGDHTRFEMEQADDWLSINDHPGEPLKDRLTRQVVKACCRRDDAWSKTPCYQYGRSSRKARARIVLAWQRYLQQFGLEAPAVEYTKETPDRLEEVVERVKRSEKARRSRAAASARLMRDSNKGSLLSSPESSKE